MNDDRMGLRPVHELVKGAVPPKAPILKGDGIDAGRGAVPPAPPRPVPAPPRPGSKVTAPARPKSTAA
jgi:hypothetical protein